MKNNFLTLNFLALTLFFASNLQTMETYHSREINSHQSIENTSLQRNTPSTGADPVQTSINIIQIHPDHSNIMSTLGPFYVFCMLKAEQAQRARWQGLRSAWVAGAVRTARSFDPPRTSAPAGAGASTQTCTEIVPYKPISFMTPSSTPTKPGKPA